jgi:hypothetical protein
MATAAESTSPASQPVAIMTIACYHRSMDELSTQKARDFDEYERHMAARTEPRGRCEHGACATQLDGCDANHWPYAVETSPGSPLGELLVCLRHGQLWGTRGYHVYALPAQQTAD